MKLSPQDVESLKDTAGDGWGGFSYVNSAAHDEPMMMEMD
jgi:hypothetical protein